MSSVIQISDFKGDYLISFRSSETNYIQSIIDKYEEYYLMVLLQDEKQSFLDDLVDGIPQDSNILIWFNPLQYNGCVSMGFKQVLLGLVYYNLIVSLSNFQTSLGGQTVNEANANSLSSFAQLENAQSKYNQSVNYYDVICAYRLIENPLKIVYLDLL